MIELRHERERRGWTLDDVAQRTRIPSRYLAALEEGNLDVLPTGPFQRGYLRQYLEFLGQKVEIMPNDPRAMGMTVSEPDPPGDEPSDAESEAPTNSVSVPHIRLIVAGFSITLVAVLALQLAGRLVNREAASPLEPPAAVPLLSQQELRIRAIEPTRISIQTDGKTLFSGRLEGGETRKFEGRRRIELEASDLTKLVVHHDGERIEPLGNISQRRRLVFIQDPRD